MRATTRRPPHMVLIAMFFPPSRASGVYRPLAMANYFAHLGWRVTVITADEGFTRDVTDSMDESLLERIHPAVRVERVRVPAGHMQTDVRRMSTLRANLPRWYAARTRWLTRHYFPDRYAPWAPLVVARALRVHARRRIDVVVATGNPWSAFRAAWRIGRLTRAPYVMDYRDSWTLNQFSETEAYPVGSPQHRWEERLMAGARRIVFVNEPMRAWHADRYPAVAERMRVVENGHDPDLLHRPTFSEVPADRPLRFGYVGTITAQLPHAETWEGWAMAREAPELAGATAHLYGHLGFFASGQDALRRLLPDPDTSGVTWEGAVPKTQLADVYDSLDVLLLMIPSSRFVTAGKTYEGMASGGPIVSIHSPETAASGPLRGYPLWFPVRRLDAESVRDALVAAARARRAMTADQLAACLAHADLYRREVQVARLERDLREVCRG